MEGEGEVCDELAGGGGRGRLETDMKNDDNAANADITMAPPRSRLLLLPFSYLPSSWCVTPV